MLSSIAHPMVNTQIRLLAKTQARRPTLVKIIDFLLIWHL